MASDLAARLERAVHWMGNSILQESDDDKVMFLFIALESLLKAPSDNFSATTCAIRWVLLKMAVNDDGYVLCPQDIVHLYEARSTLVHGYGTRVLDTKRPKLLRMVVEDVMETFIAYTDKNPNVGSFDDLVSQIQQVDGLEKVEGFVNRVDPDSEYRSTKTLLRRLVQMKAAFGELS